MSHKCPKLRNVLPSNCVFDKVTKIFVQCFFELFLIVIFQISRFLASNSDHYVS